MEKNDERREHGRGLDERDGVREDLAGRGTQDPVGRRTWLVLLAVVLVSALGHLLLFPQMPDHVPTHWGADGMVDGWSTRLGALGLSTLMPLAVLLLLRAVPHVDPKGESYLMFGGIYRLFCVFMVVLLTAVPWMTDLSALGVVPADGGFVGSAVTLAVAALFVALGNYMPRIRHNYTFGVKTPWALHDEDNWRLTHRVAGGVFVASGVLTIASVPLRGLWGPLPTVTLLGTLLVGSVLLFAYSYLVFRNGNRPLRTR